MGVSPDAIGIKADHPQQFPGFGQRLAAVRSEVDQSFDNRLPHLPPGIERAVGVLEDDLDTLAQLTQPRPSGLGDVGVVDADSAGSRVDQAHHAAGYGGLAGA